MHTWRCFWQCTNYRLASRRLATTYATLTLRTKRIVWQARTCDASQRVRGGGDGRNKQSVNRFNFGHKMSLRTIGWLHCIAF